ncbi:DMT family transporter [Dongia deserti]|uniref:DMT family transporter n=1 Tax=Dongia deserti TaxID=2268030 RepID=UPI000E658340|nr:DMT family transporter [Dongia deserti]
MTNQTGAADPISPASADRGTTIGIALVLSSALAWSTAGFFARTVPIDIWVVVFWRGIFGGLSIAVLAMIERRRFGFDWQRAFSLAGIALILISAAGKIAFIYALQNTTVANVTVIYATLPFITAIFAWLWFRERAGRRTLIGSLVAGAGVIVTVGGSTGLGGGHILGDLAALFMTFTMAVMTVIMRRHRDVPMLEAAALSGIAAAIIAFPMVDPFTATVTDILWLAAFGIVTQGGGLGLYTMGARRLPSAQAALLSASEVPMSPLWVWIFFNEVPAPETFFGGGLVLAAILWNIGAELRKSAKARPAQ